MKLITGHAVYNLRVSNLREVVTDTLFNHTVLCYFPKVLNQMVAQG